MKKMQKMSLAKVIAMILVLCMSFSLISCSGSGIKNIDDNDKESSVKTDDNPVSTEKVESDSDDHKENYIEGSVDGISKVEGSITLSVPTDVYPTENRRASIKQWVLNFKNMFPSVTVKEEYTDRSNWPARISAKDIGDVFYTDDGSIYGQAILNDAVMPLNSYATRFSNDPSFGLNISDVYAGIYKCGEIDGSLYMISTSCGANTFTYNKDLLKQNGLPMPSNDWTWAQFKEYLGKLTIAGPDGALTSVGAAMRLCMSYDSSMYIPFYLGFGGQWCDTVNKRVILRDDENVLKGVNELFGALQNKWIYPLNSEGISFSNMSFDYQTAFANINSDNIYATAGFVQLNDFSGLAAAASTYESLGIDWDVVSFPVFDAPATPCGSTGYCVFNYTNNPAAAAALVLSLYTQNGQRALNSGAGGGVPLLSSLKQDACWRIDDYAGKNLDAFVANTYEYIPAQIKCEVPDAVAEIIVKGMKELFQNFYQGTVSVSDKLGEIQNAANQKWLDIG